MGPATDNPDVLRAMLAAGLDVARFNFSHCSHAEAVKRVETLRSVSQETGKIVALLADTKGPEIRLGTFQGGQAALAADQPFTLTTEVVQGDHTRASVTYEGLVRDVAPGHRILLGDGLIELVVESVLGNNIRTRVVNGGMIADKKGVNVPGVCLSLPFISAKDRADLRFFIEMGFDFIAASFVSSAEDILAMREELSRMGGGREIRIIAKIENAAGVRNAEAILAVANGLMIARGDLGVELDFEELPILQKDLIKKCYQQGKEVITATEMLESMIRNPRPTRAETSDVANAVYDGTSAIMLSGETAMGKYPVEAVAVMAKIAERTEADIHYLKRFQQNSYKPESSVTNAISHATVTTAHDLGATAILTISMSGNTVRNVAKFRPCCPILACTPNPVVQRQLKLTWGVTPLLTKETMDTESLFASAVEAALEGGYVHEGDLVVLTGGVPVGYSGTTNVLKVHEVGEKIVAF